MSRDINNIDLHNPILRTCFWDKLIEKRGSCAKVSSLIKYSQGFRQIIDLFCRRLDLSLLYENKYGIKCFNQLINSDLFDFFESNIVFESPCDQLYIAFDGLKDQYTLLNTCILNSPHFDLVKCLKDNRNPKFSSYVERVQKGILDFRPAQKISTSYLLKLNKKYAQKRIAILNNNYAPVKVVKVFNKYFIADGKHTAATCALLGRSVKCIDCSKLMGDSFFWWIYNKMLKKEKEYKIHIEYFKLVLEYSKQNREEYKKYGL